MPSLGGLKDKILRTKKSNFGYKTSVLVTKKEISVTNANFR